MNIHANGIDIHYIEAGDGPPLILIDNAMVSSHPVWEGNSSAFLSHVPALAERFRVILPDTRGSGRTVHPGGPITHDLLADDVLALAAALELDRPALFGFSDGGEVATIAALRAPATVGAVINLGGYDLFNPDPDARGILMTRQMVGGSAEATKGDPDGLAERVPMMAGMIAAMQTDVGDRWREVITLSYPRIAQPHGYTAEHLGRLDVPALFLVGDQDMFCPVDEGRALADAAPAGELAVLADTGHAITAEAVRVAMEFAGRRIASAA